MNEVTIGTLAHPESGSFKIGPFGSSLKKAELVSEGIPVAGIENVLPNQFNPEFRRFVTEEKFAELADYEIKPGDVLVTTMGTIGRAAVTPADLGKAIIDSHLFRMRVDQSKTFPPYLCYAINGYRGLQQQLERMSRGSIMDGLNTTILKECSIPLPDLNVQKCIAAILEKADRLRQLRRFAQQLNESFLQSAFIKTFVEADDAREWPLETVEALAKAGNNSIRTGPFGSQLLHSEFFEDGPIAVLGIDNVVQNRFVWEKQRFITEEKYQELKRYTVYPNDVLITIMGTCGKCAICPTDIPPAITTKHLCCITLDQSKCLPTYLQACFLRHPHVLKQLGIAGRGAIMTGLNMGIIKDLVLPLPPMSIQRRFDQIVRRQNAFCSQQREAERQAEHLFQTLLHRAFRGEL